MANSDTRSTCTGGNWNVSSIVTKGDESDNIL